MYLDSWVFGKINSHTSSGAENVQILGHRNEHGHFNCGLLTREALDTYNHTKRLELLAFLMEKSPFYQKHLADFFSSFEEPFDLRSALDQWEHIPFTSSINLINEGDQMLCVHPGEISRVVTQTTSGTTGPSKRIYFTPEDQELTRDYFHYGMRIMVASGDNVLILLPHKSPGSLGFLLQEALFRLGANGFFKDSIETDASTDTLEVETQNKPMELGGNTDTPNNTIIKLGDIEAIVGPPSLIVGMTKTYPEIRPHSILMTADFVSKNDRKVVKETWGSKVFEHYGMTEMGLGCAMSCRDTEDNPPVGYHVRENDLYIEIIDPLSTKILPQGEWGEIVVTTLTRKGMPFLRYRTGDTGRFLKGSCTCGSVLKRLDRVQKRAETKGILE